MCCVVLCGVVLFFCRRLQKSNRLQVECWILWALQKCPRLLFRQGVCWSAFVFSSISFVNVCNPAAWGNDNVCSHGISVPSVVPPRILPRVVPPRRSEQQALVVSCLFCVCVCIQSQERYNVILSVLCIVSHVSPRVHLCM